MQDNKLTILVKDNQLTASHKNPMSFEDFLTIMMSALLGQMNSIISKVPDTYLQEVKGGMYDKFNVAASRTLELFAPEYELRPGLTAQAIMEAENKIIQEGRLADVEPLS